LTDETGSNQRLRRGERVVACAPKKAKKNGAKPWGGAAPLKKARGLT
jgi:hypothetical protein